MISTDVVVAYSQCPRKAYLMLEGKQKGKVHEYVQILAQQQAENRKRGIVALRQKFSDVHPQAEVGLKNRTDYVVEATLTADGYIAPCDLLVRNNKHSALGRHSYEPTLFTSTHTVTKEQKLVMHFTGHVLAKVQQKQPETGRLIKLGSGYQKVKLTDSDKTLIPLLEPIQEWLDEETPAEPPVILNKHCQLCQFQKACRTQAEKEDNLSLLARVTPKIIRQYEKKGIFTVKQLSYLYKPRKRKKRARNPPKPVHKLELQALAIRTGKIYLQELPTLTRQPVELFLDLEGVPGRKLYYLIGLLVCEGEESSYHPFWADTDADEAMIWQQFVEKANQYPDAPIYHYGSYEPRALKTLARRYETNAESLIKRLVNINSHIYGKVYFPVYSNSLKDLGAFVGANWISPNASGIHSLIWRHTWDETRKEKYHALLATYNEEDCQALRKLAEELCKINHSAHMLSEIDFANEPKQDATEIGKEVHSQFKTILKFAHSNYDKNKICFRNDNEESKERSEPKYIKGEQGQRKARAKPTKIVQVPSRKICPKHEDQQLQPTEQVSRRIINDLVLTRNGIKKIIKEYVGTYGYCSKCYKRYAPIGTSQYRVNQVFGQGFKAWFVYHRVALRLPYKSIAQVALEQFNEKISVKNGVDFVESLARYYIETEKIVIQRLLESPFIHVDETPISIRGFTQYVWVFTNGKYVIFKLQETREAGIVHKFLANYSGVLVSDFYSGYDSVNCKQQKCWVHLIRDLNKDLRVAPFDTEFETFILEIRNLIIPIMSTVQKYGLKKRNLNKHLSSVDRFYQKVIINKHYKSDLTLNYQKRFIRYRQGLFSFLTQDRIPWHNNAAENAIRHLAVQRKISGSFHEITTHHYLRLLGIRQTCRYQEKSFFKFLFSGETDLDNFQRSKRSRRL